MTLPPELPDPMDAVEMAVELAIILLPDHQADVGEGDVGELLALSATLNRGYVDAFERQCATSRRTSAMRDVPPGGEGGAAKRHSRPPDSPTPGEKKRSGGS